MSAPIRPELAELEVADPSERWTALGFNVDEHDRMNLGGIRVRLGAQGHGITAWAIRGIDPATEDIDGLVSTPVGLDLPKPPFPATRPDAPLSAPHPNGATAIDHVVITTPDFDRTAATLDRANMPLTRIRDAGTFRQGFRRLGPAILELVEARADDSGAGPPGPGAARDESAGPARFWGLVVIVDDLDSLAERLGERLGSSRPAVQPGRRIATLRATAGLGPQVAFMDPEKP